MNTDAAALEAAAHTQQVTIAGPNLQDQSQGTFHVHAAHCQDLQRGQMRRADKWTITATSREEIAGHVYEDMIAEDPETTAASYLGDFHFAPCVTLPVTARYADALDYHLQADRARQAAKITEFKAGS
jgi:hypothetical protein